MKAASHRKNWIAAVALLAAAAIPIAGCGGGGGNDSTAKASATGCKKAAVPAPQTPNLEAPKQTVKAGEELTAVVRTSCGTFDIALDSQRAPKTVNSFVFLAEEGIYDDTIFHRIAPEFVIQGGDPQGTGSGGPGYSIEEKPPANLAYTKGIVAMAKTSADPPGRSGSQFFIVLPADAGLPPEYALVGKVSKGFDVVEAIGKLGTPEGTPKQTVLLEKISIERG